MTKAMWALMTLWPALVCAQSGSTGARVASLRSGRSMSIDGEILAARRSGLPDEPIRRAVAEGRVKGAPESELAIAAHKLRVTMEATVDAMAAGGRNNPSEDEIERGAVAMEQGYTRSQIEAVTKSAPYGRSLAVAFDVLTKLSQRGLPVSRALEQVTSKLTANQSDDQIQALLIVKAG